MEDEKLSQEEFNGKDERKKLNQEYHKEHDGDKRAFMKTDQSNALGDSIRNEGDVNGTTFGPESNPAKFGEDQD